MATPDGPDGPRGVRRAAQRLGRTAGRARALAPDDPGRRRTGDRPGEHRSPDDREFAAEIHTHDTSGIVHVESPTKQTFTLGQFFDEWGVSLGPEHVGGLRGELTVWVDGHRRIGNPRSIELTDLRQIVLIVTTVGEVPRLPAPFDWPPQYD
ncbi:hypothetical protein Q9Q99_01415 [Curtobacterium flaccumfaciens]|nr:hypothetical protein Q9Q99_01415 [Curtobacterium flaccumfaciens]